MATPLKRFYTDAELAEMLSVTTETLNNWRWRRRGPSFIRIEGSRRRATIRYPHDEVEAWLARQQKVECGNP